MVSALVLIASLAALLLILKGQYTHFGASQPDLLSTDEYKAVTAQDAVVPGSAGPQQDRYQVIAGFLAKRYKVSQEATLDLVRLAHAAGHQIGLDPLLIIAVMAVESRFNPIAESVAGAKGLMQVIPKYHTAKFEEYGGEKAVFDPATNILVGSQILKEYLKRTGNVSMALQMYAGALDDDQDSYTNKVLNEKQRLQHVVSQAARGAPVKPTPVRRSVIAEASPLGE